MSILQGQRTRYDCGPACFRNTMSILGYSITWERAYEMCRLTSEGTTADDLAYAFDRYGFEVKEKEYFEEEKGWSWLIKETNKGIPIIISTDDDRHWLLVLRAGEKMVQIFDPDEDGPTKITKKELMNRWKYYEGRRQKPRLHGLLLIPYKKKSIKAVIMREQILATGDV